MTIEQMMENALARLNAYMACQDLDGAEGQANRILILICRAKAERIRERKHVNVYRRGP